MNKKLVAVAVAGVLAAPLAAQAQTANVTLYGRLNLDYEIVNGKQPFAPGCNATIDGCNQANPTASRLSSNSSRIGLRGTEALGGGLNAIFQIESERQRRHRQQLELRFRQPRNVRRPAGYVGHVQDGQLPDALRRPAPDLR